MNAAPQSFTNNEPVKMHLVGGFLGSGKTTAIIHAAQALMARGLRVGVITNDQGRYLVDTAFFRLSDLPAVEVSGGCFCCNYNELDSRMTQLLHAAQPEIIFAESVGSCADITATVINPLQKLGHDGVQAASFSVFTDARMLRRRLLDKPLPFSDDIVYIFDKQIEEAGLIIVNKIDLLMEPAIQELSVLVEKRYHDKSFIMQQSLDIDGVLPWVDLIQSDSLNLPVETLDIDYSRYGMGEAQLAWLDEQISLQFPSGEGRKMLHNALSRFLSALNERQAGIGHLKLIIQSASLPGGGVKLSFPTLEEPDWENRLPDLTGEHAELLVNARVEMDASLLKELLSKSLSGSGLQFNIYNDMAFHPPQPRPTHRMG